MTTIVYRDGVMAGDTRAYPGYNSRLGRKTKIRRLSDGTLIGASSSQPGLTDTILGWCEQGMGYDKVPSIAGSEPKFTLLVVRPDGTAYYAYDSFMLSGPITAEFFAIGSGAAEANGALSMGASAERAVEVAAIYDVWTDTPVETLRHSGD